MCIVSFDVLYTVKPHLKTASNLRPPQYKDNIFTDWLSRLVFYLYSVFDLNNETISLLCPFFLTPSPTVLLLSRFYCIHSKKGNILRQTPHLPYTHLRVWFISEHHVTRYWVIVQETILHLGHLYAGGVWTTKVFRRYLCAAVT